MCGARHREHTRARHAPASTRRSKREEPTTQRSAGQAVRKPELPRRRRLRRSVAGLPTEQRSTPVVSTCDPRPARKPIALAHSGDTVAQPKDGGRDLSPTRERVCVPIGETTLAHCQCVLTRHDRPANPLLRMQPPGPGAMQGPTPPDSARRVTSPPNCFLILRPPCSRSHCPRQQPSQWVCWWPQCSAWSARCTRPQRSQSSRCRRAVPS